MTDLDATAAALAAAGASVPASIDEPPPPNRTPEWHLREAEEHLAVADDQQKRGYDPTARLLAASANAQIGALKLTARLEGLVSIIDDSTRTLQRALDEIEINTRKPRG